MDQLIRHPEATRFLTEEDGILSCVDDLTIEQQIDTAKDWVWNNMSNLEKNSAMMSAIRPPDGFAVKIHFRFSISTI